MHPPAIQFTQEQVRTLLSVSAGDLRHWRRTVPYLAAKSGKAARFSFLEVVGVGVLAIAIRTYGVHIGAIADGAGKLFEFLSRASPSDIEGKLVVLTQRDARFCHAEEGLSSFMCPALVIPCDPLLDRMRFSVILEAGASRQSALPFTRRVD